MVLALEETVMVVCEVESIQPDVSFTNNLNLWLPTVFNSMPIESLPMMVSDAILPLSFHQYFAKLLPLPEEVFVAFTIYGKPHVCDVL